MKAKVSVVIPNYNGEEYLENCIDSLMAQDVRSFEIILVDDASGDDSMAKIEKKYPANGAFPQMKYLQHTENEGFAKSVNDGIKAASSEYIFLLNNDTVAEQGCVRELYRAIRKSEKIFSVGAKMVSLHEPEKMDDGGDYYNALGWAFSPARDKPVKNYEHKKKIFSACGGAAMYRRAVLEEIGYFDENHFAYLEDVDLGYRAKLYGYENVFAPRAVVQHAGSASSGSRYNAFKARLTARNNIYLIYKNMPVWQLILNLPLLTLGTLIKWLFYVKQRLGSTYFKGMLEGLKLCKAEEGRKHRLNFQEISPLRCIKIQAELLINIIRRFAW